MKTILIWFVLEHKAGFWFPLNFWSFRAQPLINLFLIILIFLILFLPTANGAIQRGSRLLICCRFAVIHVSKHMAVNFWGGIFRLFLRLLKRSSPWNIGIHALCQNVAERGRRLLLVFEESNSRVIEWLFFGERIDTTSLTLETLWIWEGVRIKALLWFYSMLYILWPKVGLPRILGKVLWWFSHRIL